MEIMENGKISFYEHLEPILSCAQKFYRRTSIKGLMLEKAGIDAQRWSDFVTEKKKFTAYYVWKILQSIKLTPEQYEEDTGVKFSKEQKKELKYQKFVDNHRDLILKMMDDPEYLKAVKGLTDPDIMEIVVRLSNKT